MVTSPVFVIAEAGVNHNGSLDLALRLIDAAAEAGADAVKFQTFRATELASRSAPKAGYQTKTTGSDESQFEMVRRLELDEAAHRELAAHCKRRRILFMSTAFDPVSLAMLQELGVDRLKVPSGEITNPVLLRAVARTGLDLILSTGMSTLSDIEWALDVVRSEHARATPTKDPQITLLHCTTEYPAPLDEVNLRAMATMSAAFGLPVGYSDHTSGIHIPIAAVALGATLIEKHFTLDRAMPGPDHAASLQPGELTEMVRGIRAVELALGDGRKRPTKSEQANIAVARRSLVAAKAIKRGEPFTSENLTVKRPGSGVPATRFDEHLGRAASRDYEADDLIES